MSRGVNNWGSGGKPPPLPPLVAPDNVKGKVPRGYLPPDLYAIRAAKLERRAQFVEDSRAKGYRDTEIRKALGLPNSTFSSFLASRDMPGRRHYNHQQRRANVGEPDR